MTNLYLLVRCKAKKEDIHADLCAHGKVKVEIGHERIAGVEDDEDWTISATALFLLRTLERNHTKENQVGERDYLPSWHLACWRSGVDLVWIWCGSGVDLV